MSKVDETRQKWSEAFDSFDTSGNGQLTIQELKEALKGMGANLSDQEIVVSTFFSIKKPPYNLFIFKSN